MPISLITSALLLVAAQAPTSTAQAVPVDPNKKVCKTIKEPGTRLGGARECRTQAEWNRIAEEQSKKAQNNMGR